jgi:uncharacterized protein (TIGR00725 family)
MAALAGWTVLTGGGGGVMAAANRGATEAGGLSIGVLPTANPGEGYPNRWVQIPIHTGMGMARNVVNVLSARLAVAIGGGAGTLSEIAIAMKGGVELWCVQSWRLQPPPDAQIVLPRSFSDEARFLKALKERLIAENGVL